MKNYTPDNWVVIKMKSDAPHYRVLAGWSGNYLVDNLAWRMNSGITKVEENGGYYNFSGFSGSTYHCGKEFYGLKMNNAYILEKLKVQHGDKVELIPEDTDWMKVDWILSS
tara:strand:+ start:4013 stop:4345 length:333 start_codon:yes stop_codon:yes gene_type:complete